jgi:hypothetical protein
MKPFFTLFLLTLSSLLYSQDPKTSDADSDRQIITSESFYCQLRLKTKSGFFDREPVIEAYFDKGKEIITMKRDDLKRLNDKDLPTPAFMLNYFCKQYNLKVIDAQKTVDGGEAEYFYLLVQK